MSSIIQFIFAAVMIFGAFVIFIVVVVCGWAIGTVYMWIDGAAREEVKPGTVDSMRQLCWWNRPKRQ